MRGKGGEDLEGIITINNEKSGVPRLFHVSLPISASSYKNNISNHFMAITVNVGAIKNYTSFSNCSIKTGNSSKTTTAIIFQFVPS